MDYKVVADVGASSSSPSNGMLRCRVRKLLGQHLATSGLNSFRVKGQGQNSYSQCSYLIFDRSEILSRLLRSFNRLGAQPFMLYNTSFK